MSDETENEQDLENEMQQLMEQERAEKAAATATVEEPASEPQPEPTPEPVQDAQVQTEPEAPVPPVAPQPAPESKPSADDPMEWAKNKGLTSPEAMARSLQELEKEFHRRAQAGHPGYRDITNGNPTPPPPMPPPNWNPAPQVPQGPANGYPPNYGYPPPPMQPRREDIFRDLAKRHGMDPEDAERIAPLVLELSDITAQRRTASLERRFQEIAHQTARNSEFQSLMQDPVFSDPRVQMEMREVLNDGSLFQRSRSPYAEAFQFALGNLARKQLQQGSNPEPRPTNTPPVTAGGGNGSSNTAPTRVTEAMASKWTDAEFEAFMNSGGKVLPRK